MPSRLSVFIDWHNTYKGARDAFNWRDEFHTFGQVYPDELAALLRDCRPLGAPKEVRELVAIRVYTGQPSNKHDPQSYAAHQRQVAGWKTRGVQVFERPLRYPPSYPHEPPQEKGVDVSLAIDLVILATRREYDIAVVMSNDTDLRPAIEYVCSLEGIRIETATWRSLNPITPPTKLVWCHKLSQEQCEQVSDHTDYNKRRT